MQLKHIVKPHDRVLRLHGEQDFVEHSFELGRRTERGTEIKARPKDRLRKKGKTYTVYGFILSSD